jgi:hypothetical protein
MSVSSPLLHWLADPVSLLSLALVIALLCLALMIRHQNGPRGR